MGIIEFAINYKQILYFLFLLVIILAHSLNFVLNLSMPVKLQRNLEYIEKKLLYIQGVLKVTFYEIMSACNITKIL